MGLELILSEMMGYIPGIKSFSPFEQVRIYKQFFTHYTGQGRYSMQCEVIGNDDTLVSMAHGGTPMCCGSDSVLSKSGNFTRMATSGSSWSVMEVF